VIVPEVWRSSSVEDRLDPSSGEAARIAFLTPVQCIGRRLPTAVLPWTARSLGHVEEDDAAVFLRGEVAHPPGFAARRLDLPPPVPVERNVVSEPSAEFQQPEREPVGPPLLVDVAPLSNGLRYAWTVLGWGSTASGSP